MKEPLHHIPGRATVSLYPVKQSQSKNVVSLAEIQVADRGAAADMLTYRGDGIGGAEIGTPPVVKVIVQTNNQRAVVGMERAAVHLYEIFLLVGGDQNAIGDPEFQFDFVSVEPPEHERHLYIIEIGFVGPVPIIICGVFTAPFLDIGYLHLKTPVLPEAEVDPRPTVETEFIIPCTLIP